MQASGAASTSINIVDFSVLINTALAGVTNYLGTTQRGPVNKPTLIGSWLQYEQVFGGLLSTTDFPLYCKRALDAGGALMISRAAKFTDITDITTVTGSKATYAQTQSDLSAQGATTVATLTAVANGTTSIIALVPGASNVTLASAVSIVGASSITVNATAIKNAINAGTGTHGYTATNTVGAITLNTPASLGAFGNGIRIKQISTAGITFDGFTYNMTGARDTTVGSGTLSIFAASIGIWGTGVTLTVTNSASNTPHKYDITVHLPNSVIVDEVYTDFPQAASDSAWAGKVLSMINSSQILGSFVANGSFVLQPIVYTLASGVDSDALVAADCIGDAGGLTNLHSFDNIGTATKVAIPEIADPILDIALAAWVDQRKDLMGLTRTPVGLQPQNNVDYRNGTGAYNHAIVNSWRMMMSTGGLVVLDPLVNTIRNISEIGDWTGIIATKDNSQGQWFSFAGYKRGLVNNVYGVVINVGTPAMKAANDLYDTNGINPVIQDAQKTILFWGNSTMWTDRTSMLCKAEVAELLVFLYRSLIAIIPRETFDPNDVDTWKTIYRKVKVFMDYLKTNRAIWKYAYDGDQDIVDVSKATVNSPSNIDNGTYIFNLYVSPKVAMKYVKVTVAVTNSGVDFSQITGV